MVEVFWLVHHGDIELEVVNFLKDPWRGEVICSWVMAKFSKEFRSVDL